MTVPANISGQNCMPEGTVHPRMKINLLTQHNLKCFVAKHLGYGFNIYLSIPNLFLNYLWQLMHFTTLRTVSETLDFCMHNAIVKKLNWNKAAHCVQKSVVSFACCRKDGLVTIDILVDTQQYQGSQT